MATVSDIAEIARNYLRDFPRFFQMSFDGITRTYELGHQNVDADNFWVATYTTGASTASSVSPNAYSLDSRNGILRLATAPAADTKVLVEGYHYQWVQPSELEFYAQMALDMDLHFLDDVSVHSLAPAVVDVIGIHALVETLWGLLTEYARDIDVITSESIHIPASQRYRMVEGLLQYWLKQYEAKAKALNIGLERMEVFTLRRISRTTNRYVPIYKPKEIGDFGPMERVWVPIGDGTIPLEEDQENGRRDDVLIDGEPPQAFVPNTTAYY